VPSRVADRPYLQERDNERRELLGGRYELLEVGGKAEEEFGYIHLVRELGESDWGSQAEKSGGGA